MWEMEVRVSLSGSTVANWVATPRQGEREREIDIDATERARGNKGGREGTDKTTTDVTQKKIGQEFQLPPPLHYNGGGEGGRKAWLGLDGICAGDRGRRWGKQGLPTQSFEGEEKGTFFAGMKLCGPGGRKVLTFCVWGTGTGFPRFPLFFSWVGNPCCSHVKACTARDLGKYAPCVGGGGGEKEKQKASLPSRVARWSLLGFNGCVCVFCFKFLLIKIMHH